MILPCVEVVPTRTVMEKYNHMFSSGKMHVCPSNLHMVESFIFDLEQTEKVNGGLTQEEEAQVLFALSIRRAEMLDIIK